MICHKVYQYGFVAYQLIIYFKLGQRKAGHPAFWWVDDEGHEMKWSFEELVEKSKRWVNHVTDNLGHHLIKHSAPTFVEFL